MPRVEQLSSNEWHIDARVLISEVNMALDTQIPTDQCDTIGGFILMFSGDCHRPAKQLNMKTLNLI